MGLLCLGARGLPLEKAVRRNQAPSLLKGFAEGGLLRDRFAAGVDVAAANTRVLCPGGNQPPLEWGELTIAAVLCRANDWDVLRRGDVETRRKFDRRTDIEVFSHFSKRRSECIAATHIPQSMAPPGLSSWVTEQFLDIARRRL